MVLSIAVLFRPFLSILNNLGTVKISPKTGFEAEIMGDLIEGFAGGTRPKAAADGHFE